MFFESPFELRINLADPDDGIFYKLKDAVQKHKKVEITLLGGSHRINPDYCLNFYLALVERPSNCKVTTKLYCNCREAAHCIALASDLIIPRIGSWYEVSSIEAISEEMEEFGNPSHTKRKAAFTNVKLMHKLLSQYLEIPDCLDKKIPMESLAELGLPVQKWKGSRIPLELVF